MLKNNSELYININGILNFLNFQVKKIPFNINKINVVLSNLVYPYSYELIYIFTIISVFKLIISVKDKDKDKENNKNYIYFKSNYRAKNKVYFIIINYNITKNNNINNLLLYELIFYFKNIFISFFLKSLTITINNNFIYYYIINNFIFKLVDRLGVEFKSKFYLNINGDINRYFIMNNIFLFNNYIKFLRKIYN